MAEYPRLGLRPEFLPCFQDQAAPKTASSAAASIRAALAATATLD